MILAVSDTGLVGLVAASWFVGGLIGAFAGTLFADLTSTGDYDFGALFIVPTAAFLGSGVGVGVALIAWG